MDEGGTAKIVEEGAVDKTIDEGAVDKIVNEGTTEKNVDEGAVEKIVDEGAVDKVAHEGGAEKVVDEIADKPVDDDTENTDSDATLCKQAETLDIDKLDSEEDEEEDDDGMWIEVTDLKRMSLDEIRALKGDGSNTSQKRLNVPITKVVVRRLPPKITVEGYLQELAEVPNYNYIRLIPPNSEFPTNVSRRSAITINFENEQEAFWFKEKYNNMKFFDDRGNSYIACVDFSLYQDVPGPRKTETEVGTLLEESDMYKEFLKKFEEDPYLFSMQKPEVVATPDVMLEEILNKKTEDPSTTPLLQFIRDRALKKEAVKKDRELRLKEKEASRKKRKEEAAKRRQKEKEEAAKRRQKEKEELAKRKASDEKICDQHQDKEKEKDGKERRRDRDRDRQRERDKERRLRRENAAAEKEARKSEKDKDKASSHSSKESSKQKESKGDNKKSFSGTVTYSKSGNPTRWSENSGPGPRKGEKLGKEDSKKPQEPGTDGSSNQDKSLSTSDKLPFEKDRETSTSKAAFGKPFPVKDSSKPSAEITANEPSNSESQKEKDASLSSSDKKQSNTNVAEPSGGTVKRRVVKKVIKIKKVVKDGNGGGDGTSESTETKTTKKIIRVVKKTSKPADGGGNGDGGNSSTKSSSTVTKSETTSEKKVNGDNVTSESKGESEKERRNRKGRPEIQIYRPGSLRGGGSNKPSSSNGGEKEKDRDNNNS